MVSTHADLRSPADTGRGALDRAAAEPPAKPPAEAPKLKLADQLDSLVAPIALYPDPLLAQVLAASTHPVEIVEANRWLKANSTLKGEGLTNAAAKQPWDASVQALVAFPGALKRLDENLRWTTELGNAVLDQQSAVMDAVQRMRMKAKSGGKLVPEYAKRIVSSPGKKDGLYWPGGDSPLSERFARAGAEGYRQPTATGQAISWVLPQGGLLPRTCC
jgi:hypothetical protein